MRQPVCEPLRLKLTASPTLGDLLTCVSNHLLQLSGIVLAAGKVGAVVIHDVRVADAESVNGLHCCAN